MKNLEDSKIFSWLHSRYDLSGILHLMYHKKVPVHKHTFWYYMGGVTLFLFMIQLLTGILLLMYYQPGENSAYESVRFIVNEVSFGWLIRNLHSWSANLMIFFAFVHMFSVFFTRAYQKPRELTWVSGFILLVLAMVFGFSGYLLPWNELSFFATKVGTDIAAAVPLIGETVKTVLRGGDDVTGATLSRFFGFHVAILPAIFTIFLIIHLMLVQKVGMSEPEFFKELPDEKKKFISFFPDFAIRDLFLWLIVLYFLIFLALFFQWDLGLKANALAPAPSGIKPEWYFMFMFQSLKMLPPHLGFIEGEVFGVLFFGAAALFWMMVPFINIRTKKYSKDKIMLVIGIIVVLFIVVMTIIGYLL